MLNEQELIDLRTRYEGYMSRVKSGGTVVICFNCPHCGKELQGVANATQNDWDTLTACYMCGETFQKVTAAHGGPITATKLAG